MTDMAELFLRDPRKCIREEIQQIIAEYRAKRKLFNTGIMSAGKVKAKSKTELKLGLGDLGL